jgi:ribosomal protein S3AE
MEQTTSTVQTPTVPQVTQPTAALMTTLMALVENYISDLVIEQVNRIMVNHATLRAIDEGFKQQVKEIVSEVVEAAISDHNDSEYHISEDAITDIATSAVEDHDFDNQISQAVNDALNEYDFTDVIQSTIKDNITFSVTVD